MTFEEEIDQWAIEKIKENPGAEIKTDKVGTPLNEETKEVYDMIMGFDMSFAGAMATYGRAKGALRKARNHERT